MDIDVTRHIPHRPPFLFIDQVVSSSPEGLTARLHVRPDFDFFKGHYPGNPIVPGVILSEAVVQAGAVFLATRGGEAFPPNAVPVLTRIRDARFRSVVRPGEDLTIEVKLKEKIGRFIFMHGSARVGDRRIMHLDFGVAMAEHEAGADPAPA